MEIVSAPLKGVFFIHFILCTWALQDGMAMPFSYAFYNLFLFITLLWGMHSRDSEEPIFMALVINGVSILLDIITIVIFFPSQISSTNRNFSLGVAILNLVIRPITCVVLHRIRNEREGNYNNYGVPGLGDYFGRRGPYENIDQPLPQSIPPVDSEVSSPHHQAFDQNKMNLP